MCLIFHVTHFILKHLSDYFQAQPQAQANYTCYQNHFNGYKILVREGHSMSTVLRTKRVNKNDLS